MSVQKYDSVIILGAGLSGAGCARQLPGSRLFEAKAMAGGHALSHAWRGFHFDEGAHISHTRDEDFLAQIGAQTRTDILGIKSKTANWDRGQWLSYPVQNHLHQLPVNARITALKDFVRAQMTPGATPANYREWCLGQYGQYLTQTFYKRYTEKYWRMCMEELDTDWFAGRLLPSQVDNVIAGAVASQDDTQPVFTQFRYAVQGGFMALMQPLFQNIAATVNEQALKLDLSSRTVRFASGRQEHYEQLVSTVPLPVLLDMIGELPPSVRDARDQLKWTQLICVNFIVSRPNVVPWHWFYVYDSEVEAARVSVPSHLCEWKGSQSAFQAEVFRRNDEPFELDDLREKVALQLCPVLGIASDEIEAVENRLVPFGYVIPCLGHAAASAHILEWLKSQSIETAGLFGRWKYVWSDAAYRSGEQAAAAVKAAQS